MKTGERLLGAGALLMALCCAVGPLLAGAVGGSLVAGAGVVGAVVGVAVLVAAAVFVLRRRRRQC